MAELNAPVAAVSADLLDALKSFPRRREAKHCGTTFHAESLDIYATCPACGQRVKVRAYSAGPELEDVFDAVFAWMAREGDAAACRRIAELRAGLDD